MPYTSHKSCKRPHKFAICFARVDVADDDACSSLQEEYKQLMIARGGGTRFTIEFTTESTTLRKSTRLRYHATNCQLLIYYVPVITCAECLSTKPLFLNRIMSFPNRKVPSPENNLLLIKTLQNEMKSTI